MSFGIRCPPAIKSPSQVKPITNLVSSSTNVVTGERFAAEAKESLFGIGAILNYHQLLPRKEERAPTLEPIMIPYTRFISHQDHLLCRDALRSRRIIIVRCKNK